MKKKECRKDGKIVAERDDMESATRYAVMMLRYAQSEGDMYYDMPDRVDTSDYDPLEEFSR